MDVFIYFTNIRGFHFSILYLNYLQTFILCVTMFYKTAFYYLPPADRPGMGDYKMPSVRASVRPCVRASVRHVFTKAFLSLIS